SVPSSSCFTASATTENYPLSLHDALPISPCRLSPGRWPCGMKGQAAIASAWPKTPTIWDERWAWDRKNSGNSTGRVCSMTWARRSEEHTSELQSRENLVCRLLLEKKKKR